MKLHEIFREIRKSKKISQKEIANQSGITPVMISMYENGKANVSIKTLDKLCSCLDCRIRIVNN